MSKEAKKPKVIRSCPVCHCNEYEGASMDLNLVFCTNCGCTYKQVIYNPAKKGEQSDA